METNREIKHFYIGTTDEFFQLPNINQFYKLENAIIYLDRYDEYDDLYVIVSESDKEYILR